MYIKIPADMKSIFYLIQGFLYILGCHAYNITLKESLKNVPDIIRNRGYPCEEHQVVTEDNYVLTLHRIPHGKKEDKWGKKKRTPIFLQHGLLSSSASWTLDLPIKTAAFIFADEGYDVWMGNARGNQYSRKNLKLDTSEKEFWNFSFDEMAYYDLPAEIDYVLNATNYSQLYYVGHSMGTTMFFALMSRRPEFNAKIKEMFALAPVAKVTYLHKPLSTACNWNAEIQIALETIDHYEFLAEDSMSMDITDYICGFWLPSRVTCETAIFSIVGFDYMEFKEEWMPAVLSDLLSGTSIYAPIHYAQEHVAQKFQRFDYGDDNINIYGQNTPPEYSLKDVTVPITLISGYNDYLASPQDVQFLIDNLPNAKHFQVEDLSFNHLDFLWAIHSYRYVYHPILKAIGHF